MYSALEAYGDDKILREKIAIRQKTFPIYLMLFYIDRKDTNGIKQSIKNTSNNFDSKEYMIDIKENTLIIKKVTGNKKEYLDLLLLADEQESMIDKYLKQGEMFILEDDGVKAECVVTKEGEGTYEIKNIAVLPECQQKGYGKKLIEFLFSHYTDIKVMLVGTGDVPSALGFYCKCGFIESHRVENFFIDNYTHSMFENGKQLIDMVYLKRER